MTVVGRSYPPTLGILCGLEPRRGEGSQWWERPGSQNVSKVVSNITACLKLFAAPGIIATLWQEQ